MSENFGESINYAIINTPIKRYIPYIIRCYKGILLIIVKGIYIKLLSLKYKRLTKAYISLSTLIP